MMTKDRFELREGEEDFDAILNDPEFQRIPPAERRSQYSKNPVAAMAAADAPSGQGGGGTGSSKPGATEKQIAYITSLAQERGLEVKASWLATKASASQAIDNLLALPKSAAAAAPTQGHPATDKQKAFVRTLLAERAGVPAAEAIRNILNEARLVGPMTADLVSTAITSLLEIPKATPEMPLEKGDIHVVDGKFVRVHISQGSGNPYACVAHILRKAVWEDGKVVTPGEVELEFKSGLVNRLNNETKATAEQAKQFATLAGRCIFCSRAIDTPESTAVGYGPVCAEKYGLPWGDTKEVVDQTEA